MSGSHGAAWRGGTRNRIRPSIRVRPGPPDHGAGPGDQSGEPVGQRGAAEHEPDAGVLRLDPGGERGPHGRADPVRADQQVGRGRGAVGEVDVHPSVLSHLVAGEPPVEAHVDAVEQQVPQHVPVGGQRRHRPQVADAAELVVQHHTVAGQIPRDRVEHGVRGGGQATVQRRDAHLGQPDPVALEPRVHAGVPLGDVDLDPGLSQALGQCQPAQPRADHHDSHDHSS
nr:hypothetical protein GCM10020241_03610 [Streptoalloteichus tenebrarius]